MSAVRVALQDMHKQLTMSRRSDDRMSRLREVTSELEEKSNIVYMMMKFTPMLLLVVDKKRIIEISDYAHELMGYGLHELRGKEWRDLIHPDDLDLSDRMTESMISGKRCMNFVSHWRKKDGGYISICWTASHFTNEGLAYVVGYPSENCDG